MQRRGAYAFLLGSSFILGLCVFLVAGCERRAAKSSSMDDVRAETGPVQESWDVQFSVNQVRHDDSTSHPRMQMIAHHMAQYETEDSTYTLLQASPDSLAGHVTAYLFDERGDSSATLTAHRLVYFEEEGRVDARDDVVVVTRDGKRLECEHLIWWEEERTIYTPGFVRITTPKERIRGYELDADENLDTYRLARVTGQVTLEEQ